MTLFYARQVRPMGHGSRVIRAYLIQADDETQALQMARDAFPRPSAEFDAKWVIQHATDPREGKTAAPFIREVDTRKLPPFTLSSLTEGNQ